MSETKVIAELRKGGEIRCCEVSQLALDRSDEALEDGEGDK
jgi:hypothetical protein